MRDWVARKSAVKVYMGYWESDNAAETKSEGEYELQLFRTGTWTFMSIALLRDLGKSHELLDDLEAIFWTFIYASLHQFKHTGTFDMDIFEWDNAPSGRLSGGALKYDALPRIGQTFEFDCSPLHTLVKDLSRGWRDHYRALDDLCSLEGDLSSHLKAVETKSDIDEGLRSSVEAARADFNALHAKLNDPCYWHGYFARALKAKGWINDSLKEVLYPVRTEGKGFSTGDSGDISNPHSSGSIVSSPSKRIHESSSPDRSGGSSRLSKRYRLAPDPESMPPLVLPSARTRPTAGRATRSK